MPRERERIERLKPKWKVWLEDNGDYVIGPGAFAMLKSISEHGTIAEGAKAIGMSYRYVWGVIKKIENELGVKLLETKKGGFSLRIGYGKLRCRQHHDWRSCLFRLR